MSRNTPTPDEFDALLTAWFEVEARVPEPETLLDSVIGKTARMRPLSTWRLPERWIPMDVVMSTIPRPRMMPILVIVILAIALIASVVVIGTNRTTQLPPPFGLAANGDVVYIAGDSLYRANPDGTDDVQLTSGEAAVASPIFSRDGTRIAYRRFVGDLDDPTTLEVVVANADGSNPVVIDEGADAFTNPSWSPDGEWLAFSRFGPGLGNVIVAAADGSSRTDLGDIAGGAWGPSWSPDGTMLAVSVDGSLFVVNRDGTGARALTHDTYPEVGFKGIAAEWSPDGKTLLFSAGEPDFVGRKIFVVGLDGAREREFSPAPGSQDDAAFSPDGRRVAFLLQAIKDRGPAIVISDAQGKVERIMPGLYGWHMPEWSPDGTKIAILDPVPDGTDVPRDSAAIVIVDVIGNAPPVNIYIPEKEDGEHPDYSLTWQRLALP